MVKHAGDDDGGSHLATEKGRATESYCVAETISASFFVVLGENLDNSVVGR
jgi:hypothetical protein